MRCLIGCFIFGLSVTVIAGPVERAFQGQAYVYGDLQHVTLHAHHRSLKEVVERLAQMEAPGVIVDQKVKGYLSFDAERLPWKTVWAVLLAENKLSAEKQAGVWIVKPDKALAHPVHSQLLIKATLLSVDEDEMRKLGVSFLGRQGVTGDGYRAGQVQIPLSAGGVLGALGVGSLFALEIGALESVGKAKVISSPRVRVSDGETANIEAGVEVPYFERTYNGGQVVKFKKAVVGLHVRAQIYPGQKIGLEIDVRQDKVGEMIQDSASIQTQNMHTKTIVGQGETVVLAGLYTFHKEVLKESIPGISSIPLLGRAFSLRKTRLQKRQMLILVTPRVLEQLG